MKTLKDMDKRIPDIVNSEVKEFIESLMMLEIRDFLDEQSGSRNDFYERYIE